MKNKTQSCLSLLFYISVFTPTILLPQSLKMMGVRIWDSEKKAFGEFSDIDIQKGIIRTIRPSSQAKKEIVRYLLPGFCDASVTLGADSLGGEVSKEALPFHLLSFLSTGFSHVESVADPDLRKVKEEIAKGKLTSPIILQSQKPILLPSHFPEDDQPKKQYQMSSGKEEAFLSPANEEDRSKILPVFLKRTGNNSYDETDLFRLRIEAEKNGYIPVLYSFADPLSWEDALDAGYKVLFHAFPPNANLEPIQKRNYTWAPMMNVTYLQSLKENPAALKVKIKSLAVWHPVFREKFYEAFDSSLSATGDEAKARNDQLKFQGLYGSLRGFPKDRLLFASGSGHYGSFPGLGAMIEAELWLGSWKSEDGGNLGDREEVATSTFWQKIWGTFRKEQVVQRTHVDPETIPSERVNLVQILTRETCSFLRADHGGLIKEGGPAHFSVHKQNPFVSPLGIFAIESMVLGGKLVYTPKPEKVGKKP